MLIMNSAIINSTDFLSVCQPKMSGTRHKLYVRKSSFVSSWHVSCYLDGTFLSRRLLGENFMLCEW